MTFGRIAFKMFKADIKKYRLFILCNLFSISVLYSFISISINEQFMNKSIVDPMISGNIYAPTFLVLIFMGIFLPYSQNVFIKARQKDYGILLSLGMTENEVRKSVIIENLLLCIVSLIIGLMLGTVLYLFFLGFIRNVIGIYNINITISILSYGRTIIYVVAIFIISLIMNVHSMTKSTVYTKIKYSEKTEVGSYYSIILICGGVVFTIIALIITILFYHINSDVWFISLLFCIVGSFLIFFNGVGLIEYFQNRYYKRYTKNIWLFSDIKYYYNKNKKIFFVNTWLFFGVLFFVVLCLFQYPNLIKNSSAYHPFHMAYVEIKNHFESLVDDEIETIAHKNNNSITTKDNVSFVRNNVFTIFCVDDVNKILKENYKVKSNSFIYVYLYYINDGYEHDYINSNLSNISINSNEGTKKFNIQDTIINPLFGQINCISTNVILANKEDYEWISLNAVDYHIQGTLHLYNFSNWNNSSALVNEVSNKLFEKNSNTEKGEPFYKISSRIEAYNTALKSSDFLIFVFIYVCLLLYFSAIIMIQFKLKMEYKNDKKKYFSLYRIGIGEREIKKMISQKILIIYFISPIYAIIINIVFSYYTFGSAGYGSIGVLFTIITSIIFLLIHMIVYKFYFSKYYKGVISELK